MNLKLIRQLLMVSKYLFYAFFLQALFSSMLLANTGLSQNSINDIYVSIEVSNMSLNNVFRKLEQQTDFNFSYNLKNLDTRQRVILEHPKASLATVLTDISNQARLHFKRINTNIFVKKLEMPTQEKSPLEEVLAPQQVRISGKVTAAEDGEPLPGVSILIKGTSTGTTTDIDGNYSLTASEGSILQFSYIGFQLQEVTVGNQSTLNIALQADLEQLEEVIVVGYGAVKKSDLTGAVSSVNANDIQQVPVLGLDQALQGRAPGVFVSNNNANPGGSVNIRIRGTNSIQGNNEPLYVVDGYIGADINTINPSDIQSMEVLKDASSTAIYGARGANGVVIITTKRGNSENSKVTFDMFYGVQSVANKIDLMGSQQFAETVNAVNANLGRSPLFANTNNLANNDWQDEILRDAIWQNYAVSASGGTGKLNYFVSGAYTNQEGIVKETNFERFTLRTNLDANVSDKVKIGTRVGFTSINRTLQDGEEFGNVTASNHPVIGALLLPPTSSVRDAEGNLLKETTDAEGSAAEHPLYFLENVQNNLAVNLLNANLFAEFQLFKPLKFRSSFGFDVRNSKNNRYKPRDVFEFGPASNTNQADINTLTRVGWLQENYFTFDQELGGSKLQITVGNTLQGSSSETFQNTVRDFAVDDFAFNNLSAGETIAFYSSGMSDWTQASFFGRINYTLGDKYLFTLNGRYDGNSKFGRDNKWGFFPSAAVAWRLVEEDFFSQMDFLTDLKLRASYGISGSEALGPYSSLASLTSFNEAYILDEQPVVGYWPNRLPNPNLSWEETAQLDIGIDASVFNGRLNLVMDYFQKTTNDLFLNKPVPQTSGVSTVLQNIGSLKNTGLEFGINAIAVDNDDFTWDVSFNATVQNSEVLELGEQNEILRGNFGGALKLGNMQIIRVGEQLGSFYGYKTDGTWSTTDDLSAYTQFGNTPQPGDQKFVDANGDGDVNAEDRQIIGNAQPRFFGGFNNTLSYKGFDLSVFMQFVSGMHVLNAASYDLMDGGTINTNKHVDLANAWTESNQDTDIPKLGVPLNSVILDRFVEEASFVRLREITLGYNLPASLLGKAKISNARIYLTGTNLLTFTGYSGYDPEVNIAGGSANIINTDNGSYPRARSIIMGLNVSF